MSMPYAENSAARQAALRIRAACAALKEGEHAFIPGVDEAEGIYHIYRPAGQQKVFGSVMPPVPHWLAP